MPFLLNSPRLWLTTLSAWRLVKAIGRTLIRFPARLVALASSSLGTRMVAFLAEPGLSRSILRIAPSTLAALRFC